MKTYYSRGLIVVKDKFNITYLLSKIEYFYNEDETFKYVFTPSYSTISLLKPDIFQGLPGLNLDIKKEKYERINRVPVFISERVPNKNREDYYELLKEVNMEYMDPVEYLIRVKGQYFGDPYFVITYKYKEKIDLDNLKGKYTNTELIKIILDNIAIGNDIIFNDTLINDDNRKLIYDILIKLYKRSVTYKKEKRSHTQAEGNHVTGNISCSVKPDSEKFNRGTHGIYVKYPFQISRSLRERVYDGRGVHCKGNTECYQLV